MFESLSNVMWPFEVAIKAAFGFPPTPLILAVAIGAIAWVGFRRASDRLAIFEASLQRLARRLSSIRSRQDFALAVEELNDEFTSDEFVGHAWSGYSAELYFDESTGSVKNSLHPGDFFNERLYRRGKVNLRAFESMPNLLVGLGLLFTFLGLVAALLIARDGIAGTADIEQSKEALRQLLGASAAKFLTSVAALASSLAFAWAMNKRLHVAEELLEEINHNLERLVKFVTVERLTEDANQQLAQQTAQLERFNQDLAVSIAQALDDRIGKTFAGALRPVHEAIDGMAEKLGDINQSALERMVDQFSSELSGAAQEHTTRMAEMLEATSRSIGELPAKIDAAGEHFREQMAAGSQEIAASFAAASENMDEVLQQSSDEMAAALTGAATKVQETMQSGVTELSNSMIAAVDNLDEAIARGGKHLEASLGSAADRMELSVQSMKLVTEHSVALAEQFDTALENAKSVAESLGTLMTQVSEAGAAAESLGTLAAEMNAVAQKLEDAAGNVERVAEQAAEMIEKSSEFMEGLTARVDGINRDLGTLNNALATTLQKTFDGLGQFSERTTTFIKSVDKDLAEAVGRLSGAVQQLDEVMDDLPKRGDFKAFSDTVAQLAGSGAAVAAE